MLLLLHSIHNRFMALSRHPKVTLAVVVYWAPYKLPLAACLLLLLEEDHTPPQVG